MLKNQTIKINLGNDKFLVVSIDTYDNQKVELDDVSLWIADSKNNFIQDIVTVTPVRKFNNKNMTLETDNSKLSVLVWEDKNYEDYTFDTEIEIGEPEEC